MWYPFRCIFIRSVRYMQGPEEFCRKIDMKLRQSIILTLAVLFAAACGAATLMYIFAPIDDVMVDSVRDGKISTGSCGEFLMSSAQTGDNGGFNVVHSELSDGIFTAVICGENLTEDPLTLTPADFSVYATDTSNGGMPSLCSTDMIGNVVIPAGSVAEFSISATVPRGFTYENCKASVIISVKNSSEKYGLTLN